MTEREIVARAVLKNYPLRLWHRQFMHSQELLREFQLLIAGRTDSTAHDVPIRLLAMADMFVSRYGAQMDALTAARQEAFDAGLVTVDSVVPLPAETPQIIPPAMVLLREVDDYCRSGDLLTLARPPEVVALQEWSTSQMLSQFDGGEPVPWAGPVD